MASLAEIVRTRSLDQPMLGIGRGSDCDLQLADLAVMLHHARLVIAGPGRLHIEATGGVPLAVGGAFVNEAELVLADAPVIDIGPFRLSFTEGDAGGVAVTAERVVPPIDAADAGAETAIFSLAGVMPSKRRLAWIGATAVLIGLLLLPLLHFLGEDRATLPPAMVASARQGNVAGDDRARRQVARPATPGGLAADEVWSSGPLSSAHASLASNCGACHQQAFVAVTDRACQACHVPDALPDHAAPARLAQGRAPTGGVVGVAHRAFNLPEGRCASCHKEHEGEHEGEKAAMSVAASFCTDCHAGLNTRLPDTPLANVAGWAGHPDFRATLVAAPSRTRPRFTRAALR